MIRSPVRVIGAARRGVAVLIAKTTGALVVLVIPMHVGVPGSPVDVPLDLLLPLVFSVPTAITLQDRLSWSSPRFTARYAAAAIGWTAAPTVVAAAAAAVWLWSTSGPDGILGAALAVEAVCIVVGAVRPEWAWAPAVALSLACVVHLPAAGLHLWELIPLVPAVLLWIAATSIHGLWTASRGGRSATG